MSCLRSRPSSPAAVSSNRVRAFAESRGRERAGTPRGRSRSEAPGTVSVPGDASSGKIPISLGDSTPRMLGLSFPARVHPSSAGRGGAGGASSATRAFPGWSAGRPSARTPRRAMEEWSLATKSPRAPLFSKVPDLWCTPLMESAQRRRPGAVRSAAERVRMLGPVRDEGVNLELGRRAEHLFAQPLRCHTRSICAGLAPASCLGGIPCVPGCPCAARTAPDSGAEPPP